MTEHLLAPAPDRRSGLHNRWHPAIPPQLVLDSGDTVRLTTHDALDAQITPSTSISDLGGLELGRVHPLTGPIHVNDAEPGDVVAVHIEWVKPASAHGFTATFPGRGLMPDLFPGPLLAHWEFSGGFATSAQVPHVRIPAAPFVGTIGVAPSPERLAHIHERERIAAGNGALVMGPRAAGAIPDDPVVAREGLRTAAAHEVGGNMDIRQLGAGAVAYFPVDVPGALLSAGDAHFAQGDGETCGTAIEMAAEISARIVLHKGLARERGQSSPTFSFPITQPLERYYATTGISVTPDGVIHPLDAALAARNAVSAMVDAVAFDHGLTREQAYLAASVAGDLRISSIVNVPHAQVTMLVPESIFTD
ncbi:acetamidase/formamidase family protein [Amycolatopsis jejuensis]|uniref:acetamidase/formamidase family protein n=1 Tax=Amycolatopsis jejuensis TaxID=330084 RepID=UPI000526BBD0|nr:acetamidase/formamidase family protein [Amycolatopsis jejuensis]